MQDVGRTQDVIVNHDLYMYVEDIQDFQIFVQDRNARYNCFYVICMWFTVFHPGLHRSFFKYRINIVVAVPNGRDDSRPTIIFKKSTTFFSVKTCITN